MKKYGKILTAICGIIIIISIFFVMIYNDTHPKFEERDVSYIYDERTESCFAMYKHDNMVCIPCTKDVIDEAFFNYSGVFISKNGKAGQMK